MIFCKYGIKMGDLSSLFLFTAALCADSFAASFVCGTGKIKIPRSSAWILAFYPAAVLAAASVLGTVLRPLLPEELPVFLSASLLMLLGFSRFTASPASASVPGKSGTKQLSASGSFFLAMGLSSDNGAAGLGAGLAGASLAVLFFLSLFLSFTSVRLGAFLGRKSALTLENSRQIPGSRRALDPSRTGGLILVLLGTLKLL